MVSIVIIRFPKDDRTGLCPAPKCRGLIKRRLSLQTAAVFAVGGAVTTDGYAQQSKNPSLGQQFLTAPNPAAAEQLPRVTHPGTLRGEMLYRQLGTTGAEVSAIGMGGSHLGKATLSDDQSVRLIHAALDRGITFIDNAWDYNEGRSELLVGKALRAPGYRNKAFVMTKLDGRTKQVAQKEID